MPSWLTTTGIAEGFQETKMSYQRGITRLYVVATAIWVIWGLYRPILNHRRMAAEFLQDAETRAGDCYRAKGEAEMAGYGTLDAGERCNKQYIRETDLAYRMARESPFEIYRADIVSVATGCLLPPAGGAILLFSLFWVARGFRRIVATGG